MVGDVCYSIVDGRVKEVTIEEILEETVYQKTYNLTAVENNSNFFANNILVHNKYIHPKSSSIFLKKKGLGL